MPQSWGEQAERKLLLAILDPNVKPKWEVVASRLGEGFTGEACRQRFYKLKKECEQLRSGDESARPSTSKAKGKGAATAIGPGSGRKRKDTCGVDGGSTTKRTKKAATDIAKEEPEDEPEEDVMTDGEADVEEAAD